VASSVATVSMSEMQVQIPDGVAPGGRLHVSKRKARATNGVQGRAVVDALVARIAAGALCGRERVLHPRPNASPDAGGPDDGPGACGQEAGRHIHFFGAGARDATAAGDGSGAGDSAADGSADGGGGVPGDWPRGDDGPARSGDGTGAAQPLLQPRLDDGDMHPLPAHRPDQRAIRPWLRGVARVLRSVEHDRVLRGRPARPKRLAGRGWPELGAA
jgi:hypothetical protein